ncbi:hypothetical protein LTR28_011337 [Elasticomyces elasticus]|nr:hypothetical protein LTR28_011337 [Elasticomyces elasticus]
MSIDHVAEALKDIDLDDADDWPKLSKVSPEWNALVQKTGGAPSLSSFASIPHLRDFLAQTRARMAASRPAPTTTGAGGGVKKTSRTVPARDGYAVPVLIYSPEQTAGGVDGDGGGGSPLAIIIHGGGYAVGAPEDEEPLCRLLCAELGFVVVSVGYRLAPEYRFPTAVWDCYDVTRWVSGFFPSFFFLCPGGSGGGGGRRVCVVDAVRCVRAVRDWIADAGENAAELHATPALGFIVGGTSAGGTLSCVVGHLARDNGLSPPLTGLCLMVPSALKSALVCPAQYRSILVSREQNKDAPILDERALQMFVDAYAPDPYSALSSPFNWPTGHAHLPPTHFQICGLDPLRDEALLLERVMRRRDGVATRLDVYPGLPHAFWSLFPDLECSRRFVRDTVEGFRWLLAQV